MDAVSILEGAKVLVLTLFGGKDAKGDLPWKAARVSLDNPTEADDCTDEHICREVVLEIEGDDHSYSGVFFGRAMTEEELFKRAAEQQEADATLCRICREPIDQPGGKFCSAVHGYGAVPDGA